MTQLDRIPALPTRVRRALGGIGSDFIPYIGAIKAVDIGTFNFTTTGLGTFGNLDVDTLNFNGNVISDSGGTISFDNDNLITTGVIDGDGLVVGATGGGTITDIKDEDDMASDSQTALATQQSIKAYVGSTVSTGYVPYTGANANVDLGAYNFTTTGIVHLGTGGAGSNVYLDAKDGALTYVAGSMRFTGTSSTIIMAAGGSITCAAIIITSTFQTATIEMRGIIYPNDDATYDMGYSFLRFKDVFLSGILGDGTNSLTVANAKAAYTHVSASGADHSYLDQAVTIASSPTFAGLTKVGAGANYLEVKSDGEINLHGTARVTKTVTMDYFTATMNSGNENRIYGRDADPDADEYIIWTVYIPNDIASGTDVVVKFRWCPTVSNVSGSDKYVYWRGDYNSHGSSGIIGAPPSVNPFSTTVPDEEIARTVHETTFETISGLSAGDFLSIRMYRDADHASDDYPNDVFVFLNAFIEYTADKLGTAT